MTRSEIKPLIEEVIDSRNDRLISEAVYFLLAANERPPNGGEIRDACVRLATEFVYQLVSRDQLYTPEAFDRFVTEFIESDEETENTENQRKQSTSNA